MFGGSLSTMLHHQVPAWLVLGPVLAFAAVEALRVWRDAHQPDHHAELLDVQRALIKSHESSVSAIAELAKGSSDHH